MSEPQEVGKVNWCDVLGFTHLFRGFALAIHPHKMTLALAGLILAYAGGRVMDGFTPDNVYRREITQYANVDGTDFRNWKEKLDQDRVATFERSARKFAETEEQASQIAGSSDAFDRILKGYRKDIEEQKRHLKDGVRERIADIEKRYEGSRERIKESDRDDKEERLNELLTAHRTKRDRINGELRDRLDQKEIEFEEEIDQLRMSQRHGVFQVLMAHEIAAFNDAIQAIFPSSLISGLTGSDPSDRGVLRCLIDALHGPLWLLAHHPFYFVFFAILWLAIWALFGGAICRIAALHAARDEKISAPAALQFSMSRFFSFLFAPLIPLGIIAIIGFVLVVVSFITQVKYLTSLVSILMFLPYLAGFIMALVLVGGASGVTLMHPTIAAEGTDSFDAVSRAFSYVYSQPWRLGLYTVVAFIYGAICYLVVRLFAFLILRMTHFFLAFGQYPRMEDGQSKIDHMWTAPTYWDLHKPVIDPVEPLGIFFIDIWVYLLIAIVASFVVSYFFSSSTLIYFLLRKHVDATDLEDVYLEEESEQPAEPSPDVATAEPTSEPEGEKPNQADSPTT